jgi:hypothetical protein
MSQRLFVVCVQVVGPNLNGLNAKKPSLHFLSVSLHINKNDYILCIMINKNSNNNNVEAKHFFLIFWVQFKVVSSCVAYRLIINML